MKISRRHVLTSGLALSVSSRLARAEAWPTRLVRFLVGLPAGGGADAVARVLADRLSQVWSQPVIVENKSGAGGHPAYEAAAHAPADGYTILMATRAPGLGPLLSKAANYQASDFQPLTLVGKFPMLLAVPNASPATSLAEFVRLAKDNPGKVTYASTGVGTIGHLAGELLKRVAGIDMVHVPYRGASMGAMSDLIAGRVDAMFNGIGSLIGAVRAGQVRGLAVTTADRFATVPEIPGFREYGMPNYDVTLWYGLFAPHNTPAPVVEKIHGDVVRVLAEAQARAKIEPVGIEIVGSTPSGLATAAEADMERLGPLIRDLNLSG